VSALVEACELIGGPQVRNVATLGGNVAHALPAADGTIALVALDAQASLASSDGIRWLPLLELFAGPGRPTFDPSREILAAFRLPRLGLGEASAFERVMRPQGVAIAILNLALWLRASPAGRIEDLRIAVGPSGPRPFRARQTEAVLRDRTPDHDILLDAAESLRAEATFRTSPHRATAEYRDHLAEVLLRRTFWKAWAAWERRRGVPAQEGLTPCD
jgi:carbon-monoxide dehydrogenase medium subunit